MFSFFRKKPQKQTHPLFGSLVYRANRNKENDLTGFWEGRLDLGLEEPTKVVVWGGTKTHPHPEQSALLNRIIPQFEDYVEQSKRGILQHIQEQEEHPLYPNRAVWALDQLYFQAYPMSERLQRDLPEVMREGVAWGMAFQIKDLLEEGEKQEAFSALIGLDWHPLFPFTYY